MVTAIGADVAVLSQASASEVERLAALTYLGLSVGDVHQPLHVSFTDDSGGHAIDARGPCSDDLHAVWETCLIERTLGRDVRHIAVEFRSRVTEAERAAWTRPGAKDWANESFLITTAETVRYGLQTETGCWYEADHEALDLDEEKTVVTTRRLTRAGIRLGHLLNQALGGE